MDNQRFSRWFSRDRAYFALGEYAATEEVPSFSLVKLLGLQAEQFKDFTKDLLELLGERPELTNLSSGIRAYSQFQDILAIRIDGQNPTLYRHHCYYESLVYLRESIVSWLDGNILAALTLLRPFVESSVLHLYWYLRSQTHGYDDFYAWLDGNKPKPPTKNQFNYVFSNLPCKDVLPSNKLERRKDLLYKAYQGLCTYNHTPKVQESIINMSNGVGIVSIDSLLYYLLTSELVLQQIVYLYILAYPISLFPVDRYSRWGFSGGTPGLYFDQTNYWLLQAYLGKNNVERMKGELSPLPEIAEQITWFESDPILVGDEIEKDWETFVKNTRTQENPENISLRIALYKAFNRASGWALNYVPLHKKEVEPSDEQLEKVMQRIKDW
jgi:hypothetical protein